MVLEFSPVLRAWLEPDPGQPPAKAGLAPQQRWQPGQPTLAGKQPGGTK